jgi:hypothetical protein
MLFSSLRKQGLAFTRKYKVPRSLRFNLPKQGFSSLISKLKGTDYKDNFKQEMEFFSKKPTYNLRDFMEKVSLYISWFMLIRLVQTL